MDDTISVELGQIRIKSIVQWCHRPNIMVYDIDCHSKYPFVFSTALHPAFNDPPPPVPAEALVMLGAIEESLNTVDTKDLTVIRFTLPDDNLRHIFTQNGKYDIMVAIWAYPKARGKQVWEDHSERSQQTL